jgi:outer membrane protein assembly factor BamE (lipoprotein component of BamABCDE complex)
MIEFAAYLMKNGTMTLDQINKGSKLGKKKVAEALSIFIKHDLVRARFDQNEWAYVYSFERDKCLLRLSLPRFLLNYDQKKVVNLSVLTLII